jgi:hypothetical protein
MGHPDFRVGGRIFATLGGQKGSGAVSLTPSSSAPSFSAIPRRLSLPGAWARPGPHMSAEIGGPGDGRGSAHDACGIAFKRRRL